MSFRLILTGQHEETIDQILREFDVKTTPVKLYQGQEISGVVQMGVWFTRCLWKCLIQSKAVFGKVADDNNVIVVHGDTISTLLGAVAGRLLKFKVAHIEAGLRSRKLFHPFPEEITRLAVFKLSDISFCPGDWAFNNMDKYRSERVNTQYNTLIDALAIALNKPHGNIGGKSPPAPYGIVSIHRFENIFNSTRLTRIIEIIEKAAEYYRLIFVLHPSTKKKLIEYNLLNRIEDNQQITVADRMGYCDFVQLMKHALFMVSDGGGNQEELSYLGVPVLLMRKATERQEGLGKTVSLCHYDKSKLPGFLEKLPTVRPQFNPPATSPTDIIVDRLAGFATLV